MESPGNHTPNVVLEIQTPSLPTFSGGVDCGQVIKSFQSFEQHEVCHKATNFIPEIKRQKCD
jgi:hypothetical protein